jgi:hypothetical protein
LAADLHGGVVLDDAVFFEEFGCGSGDVDV